jgi:hypothetical protein
VPCRTCVPDGELEFLAGDVDHLDLEVDTWREDGGLRGGREEMRDERNKEGDEGRNLWWGRGPRRSRR